MGTVVAGKALAVNGPGSQRPYLRTKNVYDGRIDLTDVLSMPMTDDQFATYRVERDGVLLNEGQSLELVGRCAICKDGLEHSASRLYSPGTLLVVLDGQGKTRGKVGILGIEAATNQACAAICLRGGVSGAYLLHNLASRYTEIREMSNAGSQENLNGSIVRSICVLLPREDEQAAIATVLTDMDSEITALEKRREKTKAIKQGMMQALLTGRVRLVESGKLKVESGKWKVESGKWKVEVEVES